MLYLVITWDEGMPTCQTYEDVSDALQFVKDHKTDVDKLYMWMTDASGGMVKMDTTGW